MRGILFDEDDARAVVHALERQGWTAELGRERFPNEDDDEDAQWAVVTDAPTVVLELLLDEHDGWLED